MVVIIAFVCLFIVFETLLELLKANLLFCHIYIHVKSDGVANLLLETRFRNLPDAVMRTLRIVSCLGSRPVDGKVVDALSTHEQQQRRNNNGVGMVVMDMRSVLDMAVKEGILDKV